MQVTYRPPTMQSNKPMTAASVHHNSGRPAAQNNVRFGLIDPISIGIIAGIGAAGAALLKSSVKFINQSEEGIVTQFGKYVRKKDPGIAFVIPGIQKITKVSRKEQNMEFPEQHVITKDNATISVDGVVFYKIQDPEKALFEVNDYEGAISQLAQAGVRELIGEMTLDESLGAQAKLNAELLERLQDITTKDWGINITRVKVKRIMPPEELVKAMEKQMTAERERRAQVTQAEGKKQAAILESEGQRAAAINKAEAEKAAKILSADADKQAAVLNAEGKREATLKMAEGNAEAIRQVQSAEAEMIQRKLEAMKNAGVNEKVLALEYFKALNSLADGKATKIVVPAELSKLTSLVPLMGLATGADTSNATPAPAVEEEAAVKK